MKTYFFNVETSEFKEFQIKAKTLESALEYLLEKLLSNNELFRVYRNFYCDSAQTIPRDLYNKYFTGYSF